jgi:hypothetical protein
MVSKSVVLELEWVMRGYCEAGIDYVCLLKQVPQDGCRFVLGKPMAR